MPRERSIKEGDKLDITEQPVFKKPLGILDLLRERGREWNTNPIKTENCRPCWERKVFYQEGFAIVRESLEGLGVDFN